MKTVCLLVGVCFGLFLLATNVPADGPPGVIAEPVTEVTSAEVCNDMSCQSSSITHYNYVPTYARSRHVEHTVTRTISPAKANRIARREARRGSYGSAGGSYHYESSYSSYGGSFGSNGGSYSSSQGGFYSSSQGGSYSSRGN